MTKKMRISLTGETAELMDRLCIVTGLTPSSLVALLLRKSGKELEAWVQPTAELSAVESQTTVPPSLATPSDRAESTVTPPKPSEDDWTPIQL